MEQTGSSKRKPAGRTLRVSSYVRLTPASEAKISPRNGIFRSAQYDTSRHPMGTNRTPLAYSAYTPGPLKYSSPSLIVMGESASPAMLALTP